MSAFNPLKNARVTVARETTADGRTDPTYGAQSEIGVRLTTKTVRAVGPGGTLVTDSKKKVGTDEWEFQPNDAVWLPGADTGDAAAAVTPSAIGSATVAGVSIYTAEF